MIEQINQLLEEIKGVTAGNAEALENLRLKYLSKKGIINGLMAQFREVPAEQKREVGVRLNELKNAIQERFNALKESLENKEEEQCEIDLTR
ncbi:MAG: phenylalanine--tRNA ligase subunit alpha, partial [Bacteroidaceae bacterium]|nr:phenylalanine--tRNA ligase subunit alpha [Bacteroidaceae bacterium]